MAPKGRKPLGGGGAKNLQVNWSRAGLPPLTRRGMGAGKPRAAGKDQGLLVNWSGPGLPGSKRAAAKKASPKPKAAKPKNQGLLVNWSGPGLPKKTAARAAKAPAAKPDMKPYTDFANKVAKNLAKRVEARKAEQKRKSWKGLLIPKRLAIPALDRLKIKAARTDFRKSLAKGGTGDPYDKQVRALTERLMMRSGMSLQQAAVTAAQMLDRGDSRGPVKFDDRRSLDARGARLQRLMADYAKLPGFTGDGRKIEDLSPADQQKVSMLVEITVGANNLPDGDPTKSAVLAFLARTPMPPGVTDMVFSTLM